MNRTMLRAVGAMLLAAALCIAETGSLRAGDGNPYGLTHTKPLQVDVALGEVRILAELQPEAFEPGWLKRMAGYHAVVWRSGGAAAQALITAFADDASVYDALVSIGAVPGNNLTMGAWNDRNNPASSAPDTRVEGTPLDVYVWWEGLTSPLPLSALVVDTAGRGIDIRFGGNKALIPEWHSGCIACLYSCPGGKVSNRAYTIRDYVRGTTHFSVNWSVTPKGTRPAVVIVRQK